MATGTVFLKLIKANTRPAVYRVNTAAQKRGPGTVTRAVAQSAQPGRGLSGATLALLKYIITPIQRGSGAKDWNAHHFPTGSRA